MVSLFKGPVTVATCMEVVYHDIMECLDVIRSRSTDSSSSGSEGSDSEGDINSKFSGKFELRNRFAFVTWARSRIEDHLVYYDKLMKMLPGGVKLFGGKELHDDGTPHYHVVIEFERRVHWRNAREKFMIRHDDGEVDTSAIRIVCPYRGQSVEQFLECTQAYCAKDSNPFTFGEWLTGIGSAKARRKRMFAEIHAESDFDKAKALCQEADPVQFILRYPAFRMYLECEKRRLVVQSVKLEEPDYDVKPWRVPEAMENWKRDNIDSPSPGRRTALVLVGPTRTGKTEWAERAGPNPIIMNNRWNMSNYFPGASHVVINDVDLKSFGGSTETYWREVLGCQKRFDARDRYTKTEQLKWGFACILTCNPDQDPRNISYIETYLRESGAVFVDVGRKLYDDGSDGSSIEIVDNGGRPQGSGAEPQTCGRRKNKKRKMCE